MSCVVPAFIRASITPALPTAFAEEREKVQIHVVLLGCGDHEHKPDRFPVECFIGNGLAQASGDDDDSSG